MGTPKMAPGHRLIELAIVLVAVIAAQFLLASDIDSDEFGKAGTGIALAGVVVAVYRIWRNTKQPKPPS